eukprot:gene495-1141_t
MAAAWNKFGLGGYNYLSKIKRGHLWSYLVILTATRSVSSAASKMKAVVVEEHGGPEKMLIKDVAKPEVKSDHVLIRVHATALNRADVLQRKGFYPPPKGESDIIGLECSGVVEFVGNKVKKPFKIGEKVMALLGGGGYAEYVSVSESTVMKTPYGLNFIEAAAIPEVWLTAYQLLHFVGRVQRGENVLIHAGGSGVGTAAIQMAKLVGATAFVTAGSAEKLDHAKSLGADHVQNYKDGSFQDAFSEKTGGKGMNLILDPVGGSFWEQNVKSLAMDGRWVLYGLLGGPKVEGNILRELLSKRAQLLATTLRARSLEYKRELVDAFSDNVLPHFENGTMKPIVDSVFQFEAIADAHRKMEKSSNTGKIVVQIAKEQKSEL